MFHQGEWKYLINQTDRYDELVNRLSKAEKKIKEKILTFRDTGDAIHLAKPAIISKIVMEALGKIHLIGIKETFMMDFYVQALKHLNS